MTAAQAQALLDGAKGRALVVRVSTTPEGDDCDDIIDKNDGGVCVASGIPGDLALLFAAAPELAAEVVRLTRLVVPAYFVHGPNGAIIQITGYAHGADTAAALPDRVIVESSYGAKSVYVRVDCEVAALGVSG